MQALPLTDLEHILDRTRDLWEDLRGRRIFITGGTGFFGCWLLESFAWANDRLGLGSSALVLTRIPEAFKKKAPHLAAHPALQFHTGDVRTFEFPSGRFSHLIHAATESSTVRSADTPLTMFDTIVEGTRHTLEFACRSGVQKVLLTSSGAVYGRQPPELVHLPEDYPGAPDPADPRSAYGQGKRAAEALSVLYSGQFGFEAKIARCFAFIGPHLPLDAHFAIGNFIRDGLGGGPIVVKGNGTSYRSYLYAADLAIWMWTILFRGQSGRPYNVGSEDGQTVLSVARSVARAFQPEPEVRVLGKPAADQPSERYVPATIRAASELQLRPTVALDEAIRRTIQWASSGSIEEAQGD